MPRGLKPVLSAIPLPRLTAWRNTVAPALRHCFKDSSAMKLATVVDHHDRTRGVIAQFANGLNQGDLRIVGGDKKNNMLFI